MSERKQKDAFLMALRNSFGAVSEACKTAGIDIKTLNLWKKDEQFKDALELARIEMLDWCRAQVKKKISEGSDIWLHRLLHSIEPERWPL